MSPTLSPTLSAAAALLSGDEGADLPVLRTVHLDRLFMPDMTLTLGAILGGQFERAACTQVCCCLA